MLIITLHHFNTIMVTYYNNMHVRSPQTLTFFHLGLLVLSCGEGFPQTCIHQTDAEQTRGIHRILTLGSYVPRPRPSFVGGPTVPPDTSSSHTPHI